MITNQDIEANMKHLYWLVSTGVLAAAAANVPAQAQTAGNGSTSTATVPVTGTVPALCHGGTLTGGGAFSLGVLTDTSTGLLRTDLSAPPQTLSGAFCSTRSRIVLEATPLLSQNATGTPPAGFSRTVNYRAVASGWTEAPAVFATADAGHPAAEQERSTAFQGDIAISIDSFATAGGAALRLVADPLYQGAVTVTLSVAN